MEPIKITQLMINHFRLFENTSFKIGNYVTVFSGTNSVGKSTLLGILGNSSEIKTKQGKPILQSQFRTEFSEIFKMSKKYDPSASNILKITFSDGDYRLGRITWTKDSKGKIRPRLLSDFKDSNGKSHTMKKEWPTLFLGLSRLYPIGEADSDDIKTKSITDDDETLKQARETAYKKILSLTDEITETKAISFSNNKRVKSIGFSTNKYDFLSNSSGQDNIGQILLAVQSFERLKKNLGPNYTGGLLLIDELDAALHPSAQNRLLDYLIKKSKKLNLQVVVTTHSLSLLDYISTKTNNNKNDDDIVNDIELYYLSVANGYLQTIRSPKTDTLHSLLLESPLITAKRRIKIFTEDAEARWLINNILKEHYQLANRLNLLDITIGKNELISMIKGDPLYFSKSITILDGDGKIDLKKNHLPSNCTIMTLPGEKSPEQELLMFLQSNSEQANEYFSQQSCLTSGMTHAHFLNDDLKNYANGKERDQYKEWFKAHVALFDSTFLYHYWAKEHQTEIDEFIGQLSNLCNKLGRQLGYF